MTAFAPPRPAVRRPLLLAAAGGAVAGVVAKAADESGWRWAGDLGTYPAAWVLAVAVLARLSPSVAAAAVRAAVFFAAMTVAYYAWAALVLGFPTTGLLATWLVLSVTAVPATAAAVRWATDRAGALPGGLLAGVAGVALTGGSLQRLYVWSQGALPLELVRPVQLAAELVTALLVTSVLPLQRSTRLWALALLVPGAWLALRGVDVLYALIG